MKESDCEVNIGYISCNKKPHVHREKLAAILVYWLSAFLCSREWSTFIVNCRANVTKRGSEINSKNISKISSSILNWLQFLTKKKKKKHVKDNL